MVRVWSVGVVCGCGYLCYTRREAGIGTSKSPGTNKQIDSHRMEIIKLLITCFSESLYVPAGGKHLNSL